MAELRSDGLVVHLPEQELSAGRDRVTVSLLAEARTTTPMQPPPRG